MRFLTVRVEIARHRVTSPIRKRIGHAFARAGIPAPEWTTEQGPDGNGNRDAVHPPCALDHGPDGLTLLVDVPNTREQRATTAVDGLLAMLRPPIYTVRVHDVGEIPRDRQGRARRVLLPTGGGTARDRRPERRRRAEERRQALAAWYGHIARDARERVAQTLYEERCTERGLSPDGLDNLDLRGAFLTLAWSAAGLDPAVCPLVRRATVVAPDRERTTPEPTGSFPTTTNKRRKKRKRQAPARPRAPKRNPAPAPSKARVWDCERKVWLD